MKYSFLYRFCMCLLAVAFSVAVQAQQKVHDMSRYSKAPLAPEGSGRSARAAAKSGIQTNRTSLEVANAPIKPGGAGRSGSARMAAKAAAPANVALPSSIKPSAEPAAGKNAAPGIPDAIQEQLNMTPEAAPAKAAEKKAPARS